MKRVMHISGIVLLCGLSAFGAKKLALDLGLSPDGATIACIAAFLCNFFMIKPIEDIVREVIGGSADEW